MPRLIECVPNFSEGRRRDTVEEIIAAIAAVDGVVFLDSEMDADHNRSVLTFAGEPEPVMEAAFAAARRARDLIDLNHHRGEHPRMGATDVIPFVPVEDVTLEECAELARRVGRRIGEELEIPVFLYEAAAARPERISLAEVRRGDFEGLRERIGKDPARKPDFGPERIHPSAGATAVGARRFLVAFNANLNTGDVRIAQAVARAIREQSGGMKNVRALGFSIEGGRRAQVSMNLLNTQATPIHRVLETVKSEAARHGAMVVGCEVVGLIPEYALLDAAEWALRLENFRRDQVLELRLRRPPISGGLSLGAFLESVSAPTPTPGGGSVAAVVGAAAAGLCQMVAGLTVGKKRFSDRDAEMREVRERAARLRAELLALARRDSEAFEEVLRAGRLSAPGEAAMREVAVQSATLQAARVPLETAERCLAVVQLATQAVKMGNPNAVTDAGCAGLLAASAGEGALLNVEINLKNLAPSDDKHGVEAALRRLTDQLARTARECRDVMHSVLTAS